MLHLAFWCAFVFWKGNADFSFYAPRYKFMLYHLVGLPVVILATYIVLYYLLPKYLINKRNDLKFAFWFLVTFAIAHQCYTYLSVSELMEWVIAPSNKKEYKVFAYMHPYRNAFMLFSVMGIAALVRFFKLYTQREQDRHQLQEAHTKSQLAFLKSQVNPHFLFNALNNIYSLSVQEKQDKIAESIERLSNIMRYLTYDSNAKFVSLGREISLIENYIDIQQMRVAEHDEVNISFHCNGVIDGLQIAPVLLLPLVENAFKHGIKPSAKSWVSINIDVEEQVLTMTTRNSYFEDMDNKLNENGVGMANVRQRLDLIYPGQYTLETAIEDSVFTTCLKLEMNA